MAFSEDTAGSHNLKTIVEFGWEGVRLSQEELFELSVRALNLSFLKHALASIDTYNGLEAPLLEVLADKTSSATHIKNSCRFSCVTD